MALAGPRPGCFTPRRAQRLGTRILLREPAPIRPTFVSSAARSAAACRADRAPRGPSVQEVPERGHCPGTSQVTRLALTCCAAARRTPRRDAGDGALPSRHLCAALDTSRGPTFVACAIQRIIVKVMARAPLVQFPRLYSTVSTDYLCCSSAFRVLRF